MTKYLRWNAHRSWAEIAEILNEWEALRGAHLLPVGCGKQAQRRADGHHQLCSPAPELKTGWHLNTEIGLCLEAGYALGRKWWNNGYMTEALGAVRTITGSTRWMPWLVAIHANENVASSAVLQKAEFRLRPRCDRPQI